MRKLGLYVISILVVLGCQPLTSPEQNGGGSSAGRTDIVSGSGTSTGGTGSSFGATDAGSVGGGAGMTGMDDTAANPAVAGGGAGADTRETPGTPIGTGSPLPITPMSSCEDALLQEIQVFRSDTTGARGMREFSIKGYLRGRFVPAEMVVPLMAGIEVKVVDQDSDLVRTSTATEEGGCFVANFVVGPFARLDLLSRPAICRNQARTRLDLSSTSNGVLSPCGSRILEGASETFRELGIFRGNQPRVIRE